MPGTALGIGRTSRQLPRNLEPRAVDTAIAAFRAATRRVQRSAGELETTTRTARVPDNQSLATVPDASPDMTQILLENLDRQPQLGPKLIEAPLLGAQHLDDSLASGLRAHRTGYSGLGTRSGGFSSSAARTSSMARSSCGSPPLAISDGLSTTSMSGSTP